MHKTFSCRQFFTQQNSNQPSKGTCGANMMKESALLVSGSPLCENKQENCSPTTFSRRIAACVTATNTYLFSRSNDVTFSNWLILLVVHCSLLETVIDVGILVVGCCLPFGFLMHQAAKCLHTHRLCEKLASPRIRDFESYKVRCDSYVQTYKVPLRRPKEFNFERGTSKRP